MTSPINHDPHTGSAQMTSQQIEITQAIAAKVLEVVDAGLVHGKGSPVPGRMCVEAAVCFALSLPHGDGPPCVAPILRSLKIALNDSPWSSDQARAKGLRRLALAQLGSAGHIDEDEFRKRIVHIALSKSVPVALRAAASIHKDEKHRAALYEAAHRCEKEASRQAAIDARAVANAANTANAAAYAATYAAHAADYDDYAAGYAARAARAAHAAAYAANAAVSQDKSHAEYAESIVQILIEMKAPGCQWLSLTEAA